MIDNRKKILIITGDAGFGHRSAAEAIQKTLLNAYGDQCEVTLLNPLDHPDAPKFIQESESDYDEIVKAEPELYHLAYDISDSSFPVTLMEGGLVLFLLNTFLKVVRDVMPDLVISTYPIFQAPLTAAIKNEGLKIPVMVVVTDLVTVHQIWFNQSVNRITVPTETVRDLAIESGFSEGQVIKTGIPVSPDIAALKGEDVENLRKELGWGLDTISLLVVGSPRVFDLLEILHAIDAMDDAIQLVLVAGGNDELYADFNAVEWRHPVMIYNFVDIMPKLMRAADVVLCKAGGLITTESLASGLPMMIVNYLPGQEEGNVDYVEKHDAGSLCDTPEKAVETLTAWLNDDRRQLRKVAEKAALAGQAEAAMKIADEAWKLLSEGE